MAETIVQAEADLVSREAIQRNSGWFIGLGILWMVFGILAIILPTVAGVAVDILLGILFLVGGAAQIVHAARAKGWRGTVWQGLGGVLALILGAVLLFFPWQGLLALTVVLAAFFLANGVFKIVAAFGNRDMKGWGWLLFSGILSIIIGVLVTIGWPASALWAVGILVGIELLFMGWWMMIAGWAARSA